MYRAWVTNMDLTPSGVWHYYDGRAGMEPRIRELREDYALRKIPTASFAAERVIPGDRPACLQLGHCFPAELPEESRQSSDASKASIQSCSCCRVNSLARRTAQSFASGSRRGNYRIWLRAFSAKSTDRSRFNSEKSRNSRQIQVIYTTPPSRITWTLANSPVPMR